MRLPDASAIERAGLKAWPGIEVEWDGQWVRRASGGYTQRANSVQSLDAADDSNALDRLHAGAAWMQARGLRPVFRQTPLAGPRVLAALDADGWATVNRSHLFAMPLRAVAADPRAEAHEVLDPRLLAAQQQLQGYSDERLGKLTALLTALEVPARGIVLYADREPVASSLMSVADGIVITGNVVTGVAHRRKGYGAAMMRTGLAWAQQAGATVAALNVAADNPGAQSLYVGLGYKRLYDYAYRVPEGA